MVASFPRPALDVAGGADLSSDARGSPPRWLGVDAARWSTGEPMREAVRLPRIIAFSGAKAAMARRSFRAKAAPPLASWRLGVRSETPSSPRSTPEGEAVCTGQNRVMSLCASRAGSSLSRLGSQATWLGASMGNRSAIHASVTMVSRRRSRAIRRVPSGLPATWGGSG